MTKESAATLLFNLLKDEIPQNIALIESKKIENNENSDVFFKVEWVKWKAQTIKDQYKLGNL